MSDPKLRLITVLLDRSGSMHAVKADTEGGLRAFLEEQRNAPGRTLVTLRQFDSVHETVFSAVPLEEVPEFELRPRGTTALLDAIGSTLASVDEYLAGQPEQDRPGEVVVVILTDGYENSSKEWTLPAVKDAITQRRKAGWQILFLGADQDAIHVATQMGITADTALSYSSDRTLDSLTLAGQAVARGTRTGDYSFTDAERTQAKGEVDR